MENTFGNTNKFAMLIGQNKPEAIAELKGSPSYPNINGIAYFYQTPLGVIVSTEVSGLPFERGNCKDSIFAYHIHDFLFVPSVSKCSRRKAKENRWQVCTHGKQSDA